MTFWPVAPFAGAWIEIGGRPPQTAINGVAPFAGAWIEIMGIAWGDSSTAGRSLRGSVDCNILLRQHRIIGNNNDC